MKTSSAVKPLLAAILVALVLNPVARAEGVIQESLDVSAGQQIGPSDEAAISSAAVKVLRHVAAARGELKGETPDADKAKQELAQADKLLEIIRASLPTTRIKDRIWVARKHLEYEDSREVLPDLIPIYASLDELVDYVPTAQAKAHLDKAQQAMKDGDKGAARDQLEAVDDALLYVEADLPLHATQTLVDQARAELSRGDTQAADRTLNAAEDNVVLVSFRFDSPLTKAKAALWRAHQDYRLGEKTIAKTDLDQAVRHLEQAANNADPVTRDAAAALVAEVRDLGARLNSPDDPGLESHLDSAWQRAKALSERSIESLSTGWQRLRAEGVAKKDLIEAKLQLAYARIDHVYADNDAAAKIELAEARGYLKAAADKADAAVKRQVQAADHLLDRIEQGLSGDGKVIASVFDQASAQLAELIQQI